MDKKIVVLGMGGTIAGRAAETADNVGYVAGQLAVDALLCAVPGLQSVLGTSTLLSEQVAQIDSKDLEYADWLRLLERVDYYLAQQDVQGIVITHGTDTLEETAYFLSQTLTQRWLDTKPVVLTCAMRPASAHFPDGPGNLHDAVCVAATAGATGVVVVCAGTVHTAEAVQKCHTYRTNAFDSGDAGPLGYVEEGVVRILKPWPRGVCPPGMGLAQLRHTPWPRVELLVSYAGVTSAILDSLLAEPPSGEALRGLVISAPGNGSIHRSLLPGLAQAQLRGIPVVRASRCALGQLVGEPGAAYETMQASALSAVKARIRLMLDLMMLDPTNP